MTTPDQSERNRGHLASLMCAIRPEWDVAGCVAALRKADEAIPLQQLIIAAARYCADPTNLTPAHLSDLTNRAWDSDWYTPCRRHPEQRARRTSGECASCFADRTAVEPGTFPTRPGRPIPPEIREKLVGAIHRAKADAAAAEGGGS
jgi:hypothetical protein